MFWKEHIFRQNIKVIKNVFYVYSCHRPGERKPRLGSFPGEGCGQRVNDGYPGSSSSSSYLWSRILLRIYGFPLPLSLSLTKGLPNDAKCNDFLSVRDVTSWVSHYYFRYVTNDGGRYWAPTIFLLPFLLPRTNTRVCTPGNGFFPPFASVYNLIPQMHPLIYQSYIMLQEAKGF